MFCEELIMPLYFSGQVWYNSGIGNIYGIAIRKAGAAMNWNILCESGGYIVKSCYEDVILLEKSSGKNFDLGSYYGDPDCAMIDREEKFCVVKGYDEVMIFFIPQQVGRKIPCRADWADEIVQTDSGVKIIFENGTEMVIDIYKERGDLR